MYEPGDSAPDRAAPNEAPSTVEASKDLDSKYIPFANFLAWAGIQLNESDLKTALIDLLRARESAGPDNAEFVTELLGREAAVETGSVEDLYDVGPGATRTIAVMDPGWEKEFLDKENQSGLKLFNAQLKAYEFVRDCAKVEERITEAFIRELHNVVCSGQETYKGYVPDASGRLVPVELALHRGVYKEHPNHVISRFGQRFAYAPVLDTLPEMFRFVQELNTYEFTTAHPILRAAYAHYSLVRIHPFADGNGRTSRALASYYCYQMCDIPFINYADRKRTYTQALDAADNGHPERFVAYVLDSVIDAVARSVEELTARASIPLEAEISSLNSLILMVEGITVESAETVASRVFDELSNLFTSRIGMIDIDGLQLSLIRNVHVYVEELEGYRRYRDMQLVASLSRAASTSVSCIFAVDISYNLDFRSTYSVYARPSSGYGIIGNVVPLRFDDVSPTPGNSAVSRLRLFVDHTISRLLADLQVEARKILRRAGYDRMD